MKNLLTLNSLQRQIGVEDVLYLAKDDIIGIVYFATQSTITGYDPLSNQVESFISLSENGYFTEVDSNKIISLSFLLDQESLCFATSNGDLFVWQPVTNHLECVGSVDAGFTAAEWSPDQELLVLATGSSTYVLMTREFDPLCEFPIHSNNFGEAEPVTVGWGKKETQFHGSEGKDAAKVKKTEMSSAVLAHDRKETRISWRGDGQFFAISSVDETLGRRFVRVCDASGTLQATNEVIDGIEDCLSWRPSGNLIATSQRKPNKHDLIFLEKNGLQHGEFTLPYGKDEKLIVEIQWNPGSDVLCIVLQDNQEEKANYAVQFWTVNNYHWYLKKEMFFFSSTPPRILWDTENNLKIHIVQQDGTYSQHTFIYDIIQSKGDNNLSMVAVIDGFNLLLTSFKKMIVPPPMSTYSVSMPASINLIAFGPETRQHDILIQLSNKDFYFLNFDENDTYTSPVKVLTDCALSRFTLRHMIWRKESKISAVADINGSSSVLLIDIVVCENEVKLSLSQAIDVNEVIHIMFVSSDSRNLLMFEDDTGHIYKLNEDDVTSKFVENEHHLAQVCDYVASREINGENIVFGLTRHHRLLMNLTELASNCTSFLLHEEFLLLTTHAHTLRSIYLSSLQNVKPLGQDSSAWLDEAVRRVERGSQLVTAVHQGTSVVLQMPRGNLESIHPRALVITYLQKLLTSLDYGKAFDIMKRNRINLNLIYDHDSKLFLENVGKFVADVDSVNYLNLFLADLSDEDVTTTLYFPFYHHGERNIDSNRKKFSTTKVDTICQAVRHAIQQNGNSKYVLALLTTYAKQTQPDLETVLVKIKELKDNPSTTKDDLTYDKALKYVLYLVDVNQLFDIALGLYDFDVVLMVAQKSQKDPKEYLPFLNNFKNMELTYQRYSIDKYLKRYPKALEHLAKCADRFTECLEFVKEQRLHRQALKLFPTSSKEYKELSLQYGQYLISQKLYEDAGFILSRSGYHKEALDAFLKTTNWSMMLTEAKLLQFTGEQTVKLCREISYTLKSNRMFHEASMLLETYVQDVEESVACLIEGGLWFQALSLIQKYERVDLVETNLTVTMLEHYDHTIEKLDDLEKKYKTYRSRLQVVLEMKEREQLEILDGLRDEVENDLYSDTSSITGQSLSSSKASSKGTKMTGSSRKSRSKAGRKKYSLREGSKHEDFALREAMCEILQITDNMREEIASLLKILIYYFHDEKSATLQKQYGDFLLYLETSVNDVWKGDNTSSVPSSCEYGPDATVESIIAQRNTSNSTEWKPDLPTASRPNVRTTVVWKQHLLRT